MKTPQGHTAAALSLRIHLDEARAPISKYLYGQFIEHLGRCISDGLWAEMLQDRKFFFPVTDDYAPWGVAEDPRWGSGPYEFLKASPWKVIGPPGSVTMETARPFAGAHAPAVHLGGHQPRGISQDGLALVPGKTYEGRIVLAGDTRVTVTVRLVPDDGRALVRTLTGLAADFRTYPLSFEGASASDNARLEITGTGNGTFRIGAVSLMAADHVRGWRVDTVALLKELDSPIYRWPGGNFVSGYSWRDGIGDRDRRPPRHNPAWKGVEPNDVGIHEYMDLMGMVDAEPYVALNTGLGTVQEVAEEVQYFNGPATSPMGKLRAANGRPEPFGVTWWAVGNEMYGAWQLGYMPVDDYVKKHNAVVNAIRAVDPGARVVGVGAVGPWDEAMLSGSAGHMDLISEHIYCKELPDVGSHTRQLASEIDRVAQAHRDYRARIPQLAGRDIPIAMDEWNYWYGHYVYGELGVQYHLKDALGVARAMHAYFRNSDLYVMAHYAQTVNVIGAIKTSRTAATLDTTGVALKLYRRHFGHLPVRVTGDTGSLDVSAALTDDRKALTVAIVNPGPAATRMRLEEGPVRAGGVVMRWTITGSEPMAANVPGKPPAVVLKEDPPANASTDLEAPAYSVVLYRFTL
jgi:alpha-L-arabinofuranosidase